MASKVLVPAAPPPFTKLQVKKSPLEPAGSGFLISGDPAARVTHLEHSVRFLQEQHRLMLNGLHAEIEALRERNRDLQFQLIFNKESKESSPKPTSPPNEEVQENNEEVELLKSEVSRLEKEAAAAKIEAQKAEAHIAQLQGLLEMQAEKIHGLRIIPKCLTCEEKAACATASGGEESAESRAELRARLADAEKLVRRLRAEAERRRREVMACAAAAGGAGGAVTNLLFDGAAARHAHLQCMKNSLHASLRATGFDSYGFQNNYHFPPVHHTPDFWREPIREDFNASRGRCARRPVPVVTLPELSGQQVHRSTVYANNHTTRPRANGFDNKNKKSQQSSNEVTNGKSPEQEQPESRLSTNYTKFLPNINACNVDPNATFPELKIVVTKMIPHGNVSNSNSNSTSNSTSNSNNSSTLQPGAGEAARARPRRPHRKHAADHT